MFQLFSSTQLFTHDTKKDDRQHNSVPIVTLCLLVVCYTLVTCMCNFNMASITN